MSQIDTQLILSFQDESLNTVTFRQDGKFLEMRIKNGNEHIHCDDIIFKLSSANVSHLHDHVDDIHSAIVYMENRER